MFIVNKNHSLRKIVIQQIVVADILNYLTTYFINTSVYSCFHLEDVFLYTEQKRKVY